MSNAGDESTEVVKTPCIELSLPDGARATVAVFGAQVLSWVTADGIERLYLSPNAVFDGASPIRGGIPVCFPQFNMRGSLPKHGIARTLPWQAEATGDPSHARLRLRDSNATRRWWPQAFEATLAVRLAPGRLRVEFEVLNSDTVAWEFALALHSYLRTVAIDQVRLAGLAGLTYQDALQDGRPGRQAEDELAFGAPCDRVYGPIPAGAEFDLREPGRGLRITQSESFTEAVIWNPGAELGAALPDLPADGWHHMLCVEAATVDRRLRLAPRQRWQGWQQFDVTG